MQRVKCQKCGCTVEYNDKSVWEGNRDFEDVRCPNCDELLDRVFTDGFPNPTIVEKEDK